jgi:hypothetical protein
MITNIKDFQKKMNKNSSTDWLEANKGKMLKGTLKKRLTVNDNLDVKDVKTGDYIGDVGDAVEFSVYLVNGEIPKLLDSTPTEIGIIFHKFRHA